MNVFLNTPHSFRFHITTMIIAVVCLSCSILAFFTYQSNVKLVEKHSEKLLNKIVMSISNEVERFMVTPEAITSLISHQAISNSLGHSKTLEQRMATISFLSEILTLSDKVLSIYAGYKNGDFFQLKKISDGSQIKWLVRSIMSDKQGKKILTRFFLDKKLKILQSDQMPSDYDPRKRTWYQQAITSSKVIRTKVLLFASDKELGFIFARRSVALAASSQNESSKQLSSEQNETVIGASVYLKTLSEGIKKQFITSGSEIILFGKNGKLIAYKDSSLVLKKQLKNKTVTRGAITDINHPALDKVAKKWQSMLSDNISSFTVETNHEKWNSHIIKLDIKTGPPIFLSITTPHSELYSGAVIIRDQTLMIAFLVLLFIFPMALIFAKKLSQPLILLSKEADAVKKFDFSERQEVNSYISEIHNLQQSMSEMKSTIRRFIEINMVVASEENFEQLIPILLKETITAAKANAGGLFLVTAEGELQLNALNYDHSNQDMSRETSTKINTFEDLIILAKKQLPELLKTSIDSGKAVTGSISKKEIHRCHLEPLINDPLSLQFNAIALPLFNRKSELVGAIILLTEDEIDNSLLQFISALSSSSAITLETRELIQAQKNLFEAFVKLIAGAIDAKSPYTGGHCARVPELTKMLAQAAHETENDELKYFKIAEEDWEAIHVASWLHDCGKVTTPEYVVDKATKLETIYDRIHEVRMRFEVLRRDAEITYLKGCISGADKAVLKDTLDKENQKLDEDYTFIAQCNEGGEFMAPEKIERLNIIAKKIWLRTFDDRIGISYEELMRKNRTKKLDLPVKEMLLSNRDEHKFERSEAQKIPDENPWGFKMGIPELLYNKGELYNLSVARGTLSEEERFKINEHIIQTIKMLSELPFPKHLKNVTEIAGGHHEKMDGSGYPKRLIREDMSPVARIMAIADIFEALTASDRPYKKGKTLSEAIKIMGFMKNEQHIDAELFKLFLTSGIFKKYAEQYLKPEQIDEVDISQYIE